MLERRAKDELGHESQKLECLVREQGATKEIERGPPSQPTGVGQWAMPKPAAASRAGYHAEDPGARYLRAAGWPALSMSRLREIGAGERTHP